MSRKYDKVYQKENNGNHSEVNRPRKDQNQTWQGNWNYQKKTKTISNILVVRMDKVYSMQEQLEHGNEDRKNQREMLKLRNTVTKVKNAFDGCLSKLKKAEEVILPRNSY